MRRNTIEMIALYSLSSEDTEEDEHLRTRKKGLPRHWIYWCLDLGLLSLPTCEKYISTLYATWSVVFCCRSPTWLKQMIWANNDCIFLCSAKMWPRGPILANVSSVEELLREHLLPDKRLLIWGRVYWWRAFSSFMMGILLVGQDAWNHSSNLSTMKHQTKTQKANMLCMEEQKDGMSLAHRWHR